ncbi:hypothetical protein [Agriterribacter sp.]|uniref:hypothetical protein n=1 Tax=Agriterribacter sp. TaxID=2821509 RepID=UPI002BB452AC|nr:hypothetical protein [Agriterribacter sp.]HRP57547.1 hypothetical protein [Agriterribacter sp.]
MTPRTSMRRKYVFGLLIISLLVVSFSLTGYDVKEGGPFRSFQDFQTPVFRSAGDTIPADLKSEGSTLDDQSVLDMELDTRSIKEALRNVESRLQKLEAELRNKDWNKVENTYRKAIDHINWKQIEKDTRHALADVNKRIVLENDIHLDNIKLQLSKAKAMADQNLKQMQLSIDHDLKINLQNATQSLQKAKMSLHRIKAFTNDLEKDGLIENGKPYSIEIKNGDLYINDVKQSKKVTKKYRKKYKEYFESKGNFKLYSGKGERRQGVEEPI